MNFSFMYLRTWLIIKRKQLLNLFPTKENSFVKFVILCAPRSGSTWLHTLLNSNPQIVSYGEILRERHEQTPLDISPVSSLVFHPHHASIKAVGLKLFYEYESDSDYMFFFKEIINDPSIRIIHLIRENKRAQFESLLRAQKSQQWSTGKVPASIEPVSIDPKALSQYERDLLHAEKENTSRFKNHPLITISYERLRDDQENTCELIQNFLDTSPRTLFSLLQRQSA